MTSIKKTLNKAVTREEETKKGEKSKVMKVSDVKKIEPIQISYLSS